MLIGLGAWGIFSFTDTAQSSDAAPEVTQADTALVATGEEAEVGVSGADESIRFSYTEKLADWFAQVSATVAEHQQQIAAEEKAEAERLAEEERVAEEARIAEAKRLEEERLAAEAAERERQEALARAAAEKERKSDSTGDDKLADGYFHATAYYPASETAMTATGENLQELIASGERIVACNDFPLNTILLINGQRWRVADRMGQSGYVDFLLSSEAEVYQFGRQKVKVGVVQ